MHAQSNSVIVPKMKFSQVTMQVPLTAMLIDSFHTALEYVEISFRCICMHFVTDVFLCFVIDDAVLSKFASNSHIVNCFIRHQSRLSRKVLAENGRNIGDREIVHDSAFCLSTIAVNQRQHLHLMVPSATLLVTLLASD